MRLKIGIFLLTIFTLSFVFVQKTFSQEVGLSDYERSYQEYKASIEEYKKFHETYVLKRAQYLRYKTLLSQDEAHAATVAMLQSRDQVMIDYLVTLRKRLEEAEGIEDVQKSELYINIDSEIGWYEDHKNKIPSAITLKDLVKDSGSAKNRYDNNLKLAYRILASISAGKVEVYNDRLLEVFEGIENKTNEIRTEEREEYQLSERKIGLIDQWALETQLRIDRADRKLIEVAKNIQAASKGSKAGRSSHDDVLSKLDLTRQHLKEAAAFIEEILKEIMTEG